MALKDVKTYYKVVESQYFEMLNDVKDFDECYKNGSISREQFEQSQMLLERVKDNYERLSYIMLLFVQPKITFLKKKFKKKYDNVIKFCSDNSIDLEGVELSNKKILDEFKHLIESEEVK